MVGAGQLVPGKSGTSWKVLKDQVCSPGGSTIAGELVPRSACFRGTVMDAVGQAKRTQELGKEVDLSASFMVVDKIFKPASASHLQPRK